MIIDKRFIYFEDELDKIVACVGEKIKTQLSEITADLREVVEAEEAHQVHTREKVIELENVRNGALFTHFSLFSPFFLTLTHTLLSWPVTTLFILILHPLLQACSYRIPPARQVSFLSLFLVI
jgi:hypothetical protein